MTDKVDIFKKGTTSLSGRKVAAIMGRKVMVSTSLVRRYNYTGKEDRWERRPYEEPRPGWVVGSRHVFDGRTLVVGWDEGSRFHPTRSTPVILVAHWPMEKPVLVYPDDESIRFWADGDYEPFSSSWGHTRSGRVANIATHKKTLAEGLCPRDDHGRFRALTSEELDALNNNLRGDNLL